MFHFSEEAHKAREEAEAAHKARLAAEKRQKAEAKAAAQAAEKLRLEAEAAGADRMFQSNIPSNFPSDLPLNIRSNGPSEVLSDGPSNITPHATLRLATATKRSLVLQKNLRVAFGGYIERSIEPLMVPVRGREGSAGGGGSRDGEAQG